MLVTVLFNNNLVRYRRFLKELGKLVKKKNILKTVFRIIIRKLKKQRISINLDIIDARTIY